MVGTAGTAVSGEADSSWGAAEGAGRLLVGLGALGGVMAPQCQKPPSGRLQAVAVGCVLSGDQATLLLAQAGGSLDDLGHREAVLPHRVTDLGLQGQVLLGQFGVEHGTADVVDAAGQGADDTGQAIHALVVGPVPGQAGSLDGVPDPALGPGQDGVPAEHLDRTGRPLDLVLRLVGTSVGLLGAEAQAVQDADLAALATGTGLDETGDALHHDAVLVVQVGLLTGPVDAGKLGEQPLDRGRLLVGGAVAALATEPGADLRLALGQQGGAAIADLGGQVFQVAGLAVDRALVPGAAAPDRDHRDTQDAA